MGKPLIADIIIIYEHGPFNSRLRGTCTGLLGGAGLWMCLTGGWKSKMEVRGYLLCNTCLRDDQSSSESEQLKIAKYAINTHHLCMSCASKWSTTNNNQSVTCFQTNRPIFLDNFKKIDRNILATYNLECSLYSFKGPGQASPRDQPKHSHCACAEFLN